MTQLAVGVAVGDIAVLFLILVLLLLARQRNWLLRTQHKDVSVEQTNEQSRIQEYEHQRAGETYEMLGYQKPKRWWMSKAELPG